VNKLALGLRGAPIEGPTHFSQFEPLGAALWGDRWFTKGCISAHFLNMVIEGEQVQVQATLDGPGATSCEDRCTQARWHGRAHRNNFDWS
jgi:hypothetical protein